MKRNIHALICLLIVIAMLFSGCSQTLPQSSQPQQQGSSLVQSAAETAQTFVFVDSVGREVELPKTIIRVAPSGVVAQFVLYSLVPDSLIGLSGRFADEAKPYTDQKYLDLPVFGQFYGKNVSLNLEALAAADPQVIIDIGEKKGNIAEDLNNLQQQLNIPVIFIEGTLDTMADAYRTLGGLLNADDKGRQLASYCEKTLETAAKRAQQIPDSEKVSVYYGEGVDGLTVNPRGSIHADVLDIVGAENVAQTDSGGREISPEQLLQWNPDVILLGQSGFYDTLAWQQDPLWQTLSAVQNHRAYGAPAAPYNWMGRPPSVNRLLGVWWLGQLLYPELYPEDTAVKAKEFYSLFYHYTLSDAEILDILEHSHRF